MYYCSGTSHSGLFPPAENLCIMATGLALIEFTMNLVVNQPLMSGHFLIVDSRQGTPPFVAVVSSPPFVHRCFIAGHFVAGTLRRRDTSPQPFRLGDTWALTILSWGRFVTSHFVAGTLCRQPFCPWDTSLPAVLSQGHFVDGGQGWRTKTCRQRWQMKSA